MNFLTGMDQVEMDTNPSLIDEKEEGTTRDEARDEDIRRASVPSRIFQPEEPVV